MDIYQTSNDSTRFNFIDHHHPAIIKHLTQKAIEQIATHHVAMVLGAGNCNDIPLDLLLETFDTIVLVDIDEKALDFVCNTKIDSHSASKIMKIVTDLTGIHNAIKQLMLPITDEQIGNVLNQIAQSFPPSSPLVEWFGQCDLVLSIGVVSQLIFPLLDAYYQAGIINNLHAFSPVMDAVSQQHYNQIQGLCAPDGAVLLALDLYTSKSIKKDPITFGKYCVLLGRLNDMTSEEVLSQLDKDWAYCRMQHAQFMRTFIDLHEHGSHWIWPWIFTLEEIYLMMGWILRFESRSP